MELLNSDLGMSSCRIAHDSANRTIENNNIIWEYKRHLLPIQAVGPNLLLSEEARLGVIVFVAQHRKVVENVQTLYRSMVRHTEQIASPHAGRAPSSQ